MEDNITMIWYLKVERNKSGVVSKATLKLPESIQQDLRNQCKVGVDKEGTEAMHEIFTSIHEWYLDSLEFKMDFPVCKIDFKQVFSTTKK